LGLLCRNVNPFIERHDKNAPATDCCWVASTSHATDASNRILNLQIVHDDYFQSKSRSRVSVFTSAIASKYGLSNISYWADIHDVDIWFLQCFLDFPQLVAGNDGHDEFQGDSLELLRYGNDTSGWQGRRKLMKKS